MKRETHPIMWMNRVLASPWFIGAVNLWFALSVHFKWFGLDQTDFTMSWATMLMDQIIISASWIWAVRTLRWQRHVDKELRSLRHEIEAQAREIHAGLERLAAQVAQLAKRRPS